MSVAESPPTIAEAARLIASRQLSPVELTTACLARIESLDPHINSFLLTRAEAALAEAAVAEQEIGRGDYRGLCMVFRSRPRTSLRPPASAPRRIPSCCAISVQFATR